MSARRMEARHVASPVSALAYLLYVPSGDAPTRGWPLLLFLHGSGERGRDLDRLLAYGPPRLIEEGHDFPFIVVAPQCPPHARWTVPPLMGLLDAVLAEQPVDSHQVWLSGVSMGGSGAWALGIAAPARFAALVPVCGGGDPRAVGALTAVPVWAFHGAEDDVVPLAETQRMVEALAACGGTAKLTIYPWVGHASWVPTYADPELYAWLLARRRA